VSRPSREDGSHQIVASNGRQSQVNRHVQYKTRKLKNADQFVRFHAQQKFVCVIYDCVQSAMTIFTVVTKVLILNRILRCKV